MENKVDQLTQITQLMVGIGFKINHKHPAITVKKFTKQFGKFVSVRNANFTVNNGTIHGFIGPNGSGKTTTIKTLIGAYVKSEGDLLINGNKAGTKKANRLIGYIPERASFPKHLNTTEYLTAMGELSGLKTKQARKTALQILDTLKLKPHAKRKPYTFSSGMQKKILLAQSLMTDPSILILDEPAANLDPTARAELFNHLLALKEMGKTIFISSHILAELERIIDEVTFIYNGDLLYTGNIEKFSKDISNIFIRVSKTSKFRKWLIEKKIKFTMFTDNEVSITRTPNMQLNKLLMDILGAGFNVNSYKTNDLQSTYTKMIVKEEIKRKKKLDGVK